MELYVKVETFTCKPDENVYHQHFDMSGEVTIIKFQIYYPYINFEFVLSEGTHDKKHFITFLQRYKAGLNGKYYFYDEKNNLDDGYIVYNDGALLFGLLVHRAELKMEFDKYQYSAAMDRLLEHFNI